MAERFSRFRRIREGAKALWDESALQSQAELSKIEKFAHFCLMVWRSFTRNRCPVRASALAYATLLALVPMLAVVMSITSTFLKQEGEDQIDQFIVRFVATVIPPGVIGTNAPPATSNAPTETAIDPISPASSPSTPDTQTHLTNKVVASKTQLTNSEAALPAF